MRTSCCLAFSAGGKYGGSGAFKRNADANVEKYNMMFPTISRRSLLTEMTKSRRKLYIEKKKTPIYQSMCHANHVGVLSYRIPIFTHGGPS